MSSKLALGALLCAAAVNSAPFNSRSLLKKDDDCGTPSKFLDAACVPGRIVGGEEAKPQEFGFIVSLQDFSNNHYCGGSVVAPNWVLTAAHCMTAPGHTALMGAHNVNKNNEECAERIKIKKVYVHKNYNSETQENDIALLQLEGDTVYPSIDMDDGTGDITEKDAEVTVAGWGTLSFGGQLASSLQKVDVKVNSNKDCNNAYGGAIADHMVCASVRKGGKDACQGDSGGPLFGYKGSRPVLAGVVSWGNGCADKDFPGVYTRVSSFGDWMRAAIQGSEQDVEVKDECTGEDAYFGGGDYGGDYDNYLDFGDIFPDFPDNGGDYYDYNYDDQEFNEWLDVDLKCLKNNRKKCNRKKNKKLCKWDKNMKMCVNKKDPPGGFAFDYFKTESDPAKLQKWSELRRIPGMKPFIHPKQAQFTGAFNNVFG